MFYLQLTDNDPNESIFIITLNLCFIIIFLLLIFLQYKFVEWFTCINMIIFIIFIVSISI